MTKKDLEALASELRHQWRGRPGPGDEQRILGWTEGFRMALKGVVDACRARNPRFDQERFLALIYAD